MASNNGDFSAFALMPFSAFVHRFLAKVFALQLKSQGLQGSGSFPFRNKDIPDFVHHVIYRNIKTSENK
jgi:hypothetical protein